MTATFDLQCIAVPLHVWNDMDNPLVCELRRDGKWIEHQRLLLTGQIVSQPSPFRRRLQMSSRSSHGQALDFSERGVAIPKSDGGTGTAEVDMAEPVLGVLKGDLYESGVAVRMLANVR